VPVWAARSLPCGKVRLPVQRPWGSDAPDSRASGRHARPFPCGKVRPRTAKTSAIVSGGRRDRQRRVPGHAFVPSLSGKHDHRHAASLSGNRSPMSCPAKHVRSFPFGKARPSTLGFPFEKPVANFAPDRARSFLPFREGASASIPLRGERHAGVRVIREGTFIPSLSGRCDRGPPRHPHRPRTVLAPGSRAFLLGASRLSATC
jgi:hypothetical protein